MHPPLSLVPPGRTALEFDKHGGMHGPQRERRSGWPTVLDHPPPGEPSRQECTLRAPPMLQA
ncbi:hypothetical protein GCM10025780_19960 [Frondihabitans cladoniiphilus]|uniref:Uncharacterized protein n=1 Tax=Frondihabitans cladoniiphilus TaxID=715785 RepID=A0ABP8VYG9_9MICO